MAGWRLRIGGALLLALVACGPSAVPSAKQPDRPLVHSDGFDPRALDLARPCTLLREIDAERVSGQPFYRTMAANRVEGERVRCAHAVGVGGLHSLVEATFVATAEGGAARDAFDALCAASIIEGPQPDPAAMAMSEEEDGPPVPGRACRLANTAYAILVRDGVVIAMVRGGAGEVRPANSRRLAAMLAGRVAVGR